MEENTELLCVMASLGYADGDEYFKGVDCIESLKDMIKFLRYEDTAICNIRRQMGHSKVLQNDLLPLLVDHSDDKNLTDIIMRLLVNLTSAAQLTFRAPEELGKPDCEREGHMLQVISHLQAYKEAFANEKVLGAIGVQLARILQLGWESRLEEDTLLLERSLLLLRNILHVPANPEDEKRTDDDVTVHDQLLWSLHVNGIDDLLLYIASSPDETNWCMHVLEVVNLMLREQNPEELARADKGRSSVEKEEDTRTLKILRERDQSQKTRNVQQSGTRHSRFGGSYWLQGVKGLNKEQNLVHHRSQESAKNFSYDFDKTPAKKRKNKKPLQETNMERKSTLSIRLVLKELCCKFLEHCYNPLMQVVKDSIAGGKTQDNDESYYIWAMRFFMAFNRVHNFKVEYISETLTLGTFSQILKFHFTFGDKYDLCKKIPRERLEWARRLHLALQAYKELLMYLYYMQRSNDEELKRGSEIMQNNVFYVEEYRNIFFTLFKRFDVAMQTRPFLKDAIETFHVFLKMLEKFLKDKGAFLVKGHKKKSRKKKTKRPTQAVVFTAEQLDELWQETVSCELSALLQGHGGGIPTDDIVPFDPTSDVEFEEQRTKALLTIQEHLRNARYGEALAFLRASRECWPDERQFGTVDISLENEFMCLREIFYSEMQRDAIPETEDIEEEEEEIEEQMREMDEQEVGSEREFNIKNFLKSLANPAILQPYCYLLNFYKENTIYTNHCIIKMLHRISVDLTFDVMLFQLSLFITFNNILNDPAAHQYKEMVTFAKFILSKFFALMTTKPAVVLDILYWKNTKDCIEITDGKEALTNLGGSKRREKWTFEEEEELRGLYDQFKEDEDVVQKILDNVTDQTRVRRQIVNKLVRLRIVDNARQLPKPKKPKGPKRGEWLEDQDDELVRIYEEFKGTEDPVGNILNALSFNKSKGQITNHLLQLGIVRDKKELYKKRRRKQVQAEDDMDEDMDDDDGDDDRFIVDEEAESGNEGSGDEVQPPVDNNRHTNQRRESDSDGDHIPDIDDDNLGPDATLSQILSSLKELGFAGQVSWIQDRLKRLANDREKESRDSWQPVPLLTFTEEDEEALRSKVFQRILKFVGIRAPENEQETFWRIPVQLSPEILRKAVEDLSKEENVVAGPSTASQAEPAAKKDNSDDNTPLLLQKKKSKPKEKVNKQRKRDNNSEVSDDETPLLLQKKKSQVEKKATKQHNNIDSSDVSDDETPLVLHKKKSHGEKKAKKQHKNIDSSDVSDEETPIVLHNKKSQGEKKAKKQHSNIDSSDVSDDETPLVLHKKKSQGVKKAKKQHSNIDSSDASDEETPLVFHKKKSKGEKNAKKQHNNIDSSDVSDDETPLVLHNKKTQGKKKAKKQHSNIDSSDVSDDETPIALHKKKSQGEKKAKKQHSNIDSSDVSDEETPIVLHKKKSKREERKAIQVESDSSDDDTSLKSIREKKSKKRKSTTKLDKPSGNKIALQKQKTKSTKDGKKSKKTFSVSAFLKENSNSTSEDESNDEDKQPEDTIHDEAENDDSTPSRCLEVEMPIASATYDENLENNSYGPDEVSVQEQNANAFTSAVTYDDDFENNRDVTDEGIQGQPANASASTATYDDGPMDIDHVNVEESVKAQSITASPMAVTYDNDIETNRYIADNHVNKENEVVASASIDAATYDPHLENNAQFDMIDEDSAHVHRNNDSETDDVNTKNDLDSLRVDIQEREIQIVDHNIETNHYIADNHVTEENEVVASASMDAATYDPHLENNAQFDMIDEDSAHGHVHRDNDSETDDVNTKNDLDSLRVDIQEREIQIVDHNIETNRYIADNHVNEENEVVASASMDAATYDPNLENSAQFDVIDEDSAHGHVRRHNDFQTDDVNTKNDLDSLRVDIQEREFQFVDHNIDDDNNDKDNKNENIFNQSSTYDEESNTYGKVKEMAIHDDYNAHNSEALHLDYHSPVNNVNGDQNGIMNTEAELTENNFETKDKKRSRRTAFPDSDSDDVERNITQENHDGFEEDVRERKDKKRTRVILDTDDRDLTFVNGHSNSVNDNECTTDNFHLELSIDEDTTAEDI